VDASIRFVEAGGSAVLITDARHIKDALLGTSGTYIRPDAAKPARGAGAGKKSKTKGKKKKKARNL